MSDLGRIPSRHRCPQCQREIYLRRRKTCEFCGAVLPEAVRLSPDEIEAVDKEIEEMHERRERDRVKEEEKRKNQRGSESAGLF